MFLRTLALLALLLSFSSTVRAQVPDVDITQMYELCVQDVLQKARTGGDVKAKLPTCHSSDVGLMDKLRIEKSQLLGWCQSQSNPCEDTEVCRPVLGKFCTSVDPTRACDAPLAVNPNGSGCVCQGTTRVATRASDCSNPTPTPRTCPSGLQSKNGKCVCPSGGAEATSVAECTQKKNPNISPSQVTRDTSRVEDLVSRADLCCHNPSACGAPDTTEISSLQPQEGQGIGDFCNSMVKAGQMNADANSKAAGICQSSYSSCSNEAQSKLAVYQDLYDECGECELAELIESAMTKLQRSIDKCNSFASLVRAMGRQQVASSTAAGKSRFCTQSARNSSSDTSPAFNLDVCAQNPLIPGCPKHVQAEQERAKGKVGFQNAKIDKPNFNPNEINDVSGFNGYTTAEERNQLSAHVVPNGGAYNAGANNYQAKLDPRAPTVAGAGVNTDIIQGHLAGGYSQSADNASGTNGSRFATASAAQAGAGDKKMDLKPWMVPPHKRLPAGMQRADGVLGKWDDIWQHIRDRMQLKCKLGVLHGCPGK